MALVALVFGACAVLLIVSGIVAGWTGAAIFVPIACLVLYGAYLFGRASVRTAKAARHRTAEERAIAEERRENGGWRALGLMAMLAVTVIAIPGPGTFKVVYAVVVALAWVVFAAARAEPRKRR